MNYTYPTATFDKSLFSFKSTPYRYRGKNQFVYELSYGEEKLERRLNQLEGKMMIIVYHQSSPETVNVETFLVKDFGTFKTTRISREIKSNLEIKYTIITLN